MQLDEARRRFIEGWGTLGSAWGVSRTMAQVHALLLISVGALSTEDIMEQLQISRGNVNMNVRALMDWGIVRKELRPGERREYFSAEKDIHKVATLILQERRKRELEPILRVLGEISQVETSPAATPEETVAFTQMIASIQNFAGFANRAASTLIKADENWFVSTFMKLMRPN
ncbi:GbsR/MarR family transcriptional regulator [Hymenobacter psychrotolerans]|uniref:HTH-type transcriptional regulator n=1 Tax=Hymenobacter psychrotolerans DSM 18569 TaxID=1121959 RepID=A0A1M6S5H2_9BACT|nr:MarR family transcriptional regulator [Hymenobacter psychrotolerans]SHK39778.1 DNA-binding transcriptional regulator GbsR, MarR family [Hymenobacter psychrotolerans DSM 18569]